MVTIPPLGIVVAGALHVQDPYIVEKDTVGYSFRHA